jgi:hypothetical protein
MRAPYYEHADRDELFLAFATNSTRRPSGLPDGVSYHSTALKPLRTKLYRGLPGPGVVIGDQVATDGLLAYRLGYSFVRYRPPGRLEPGPRAMAALGELVRPLVFRRR